MYYNPALKSAGYNPNNPPKQSEVELDHYTDVKFAIDRGECITCFRVHCECDDPACELGW